MKTYIILSILIIVASCNINAQKQNNKSVVTHTVYVKGNCGQCKDRIEYAVDVKGVKYANWDKKSQVLTITYKPSVVTLEEIYHHILKAGHDVDTLHADDNAYEKLPECCKYREVKLH